MLEYYRIQTLCRYRYKAKVPYYYRLKPGSNNMIAALEENTKINELYAAHNIEINLNLTFDTVFDSIFAI